MRQRLRDTRVSLYSCFFVLENAWKMRFFVLENAFVLWKMRVRLRDTRVSLCSCFFVLKL